MSGWNDTGRALGQASCRVDPRAPTGGTGFGFTAAAAPLVGSYDPQNPAIWADTTYVTICGLTFETPRLTLSRRIGAVREALARSADVFPDLLAARVGIAVEELLKGLIPALAAIAGFLGVSSGIGALFGGPPGAAAGFAVGNTILAWLGLAMLVVFVVTELRQAGEHFARGTDLAWHAVDHRDSAPLQVRLAARAYAEGFVELGAAVLNGIVAYITRGAPGQATATAQARVAELAASMKQSRFGAGFGAWLEAN